MENLILWYVYAKTERLEGKPKHVRCRNPPKGRWSSIANLGKHCRFVYVYLTFLFRKHKERSTGSGTDKSRFCGLGEGLLFLFYSLFSNIFKQFHTKGYQSFEEFKIRKISICLNVKSFRIDYSCNRKTMF